MINHAVLSGELLEKKAKRFTPAGIPVLELFMAHDSLVSQASADRQLRFEFKAKALGQVAEQLEAVALGSRLKLEGFLAPPRLQSKQIMIHVTNFELE